MYTQGIALSVASNADTSLNDLRNLIELVLMECLVRKVTQDFFATMLDDTTELLTQLARLEAAAHAKNALMISDPGRGEPPVLEAAISKIMLQIKDLRTELGEKTMQMAQCRDEGAIVS